MLPIVFIHGTRVSGTMWSPVRARLDRPSAAPDLPGHGTRRGLPFDMGAACEVVADSIAELGGRALVVGHSLGGYVGIATAARHPELVAGLIAMGCTARPSGLAVGAFRLAGRLAVRHPALADRASRYGFRRALPGPVAEAFVEGGMSCEVVPSVIDAVASGDPIAALSAYPGRVWLLNGSRDHFRVDERRFLAACRDGSLTHLPRRDHITMLADPGQVARFVENAAENVAEDAARAVPVRA
ncbi:alpha/beta fold hydrolase [Sphaerimonospora cavernae]|uniref:Alpha/beta fold hydrolase n=1 Tax=Sphaerimonospora cavernae TaxID=1740611 RepID=A0ABV6U6V2_9ACTN